MELFSFLEDYAAHIRRCYADYLYLDTGSKTRDVRDELL
jgi:hypothetical protein